MTTSASKTKALCVATRCTSVDQFVATFHRFCGDDQTFFVATLTSRPIGIETAFSIQLADKQPVLRGLCIVLDAWATADNRYRRPGIRLGIKRLTADSQAVFDRLRAASRAPVGPDATPWPEPSARGSRPPAFALRTGMTPPSMPAVRPPVLPRGSTPAVRLTPPALPALGEPDPAELREPVPLVEVTRFQVALNVDETPPSVDDVEFRPTQLMPRAYTEPRIVSDSPSPASSATPGDELDLGDPRDPGDPAWIVDRPLPPDPIAAEATEPTAEARTPGSDFVLPANPLQNLSDESLEGFVDCTLYEEAVNVFHPGLDDRWDDPAVELAAAGRREIPRPGSVPAMPFDAAPDLMVHSIGGTESLAVSPIPSLAAAMAPEPVVAPMMPAGTQPPPYAQPPSGSWPPYGPPPSGSWQGSAPLPSGAWPSYGQPPSGSWPPYGPPPYGPPPPGVWPPYAQPPSGSWPPYGPPPGALPPYAQPPASAAPGREPGVPAMAGPAMLAAPIAQGARPPMPAMVATTMMTRPGAAGPIGLADWRRWLLIGGTAVAAILIAFLLAKLARGRMPIAPGAPPAAVIPKAAPRMPAESRPGVATARSITLAAPGPSAVAAQPDAGAPADREDDAIELAPADDDAEPPPGAIPVVGAGPCRFTVATVPSGSLIRFDEDPVGGSPLTILGSCEQHKLDVSHARYQTVTRWVTLTADRPASVEFTLPRPIHAVTVTSQPPGAEVMIDGRRVATTPAVVRVPGFARISLTLTKPGFRRITRQIYSKLAQDRVFVKLAP